MIYINFLKFQSIYSSHCRIWKYDRQQQKNQRTLGASSGTTCCSRLKKIKAFMLLIIDMNDVFQVLKRHTQKVYATPSRRKMDGKGDGEEITYPHICFTVDNFDDTFDDVIVRDGESVGIELTASAPRASINTVLFTACVPYETVRRVHEARASQTVRKRLSQASLFSLFSGKQTGPRIEYVRLLGGTAVNGHAELAVCKTSAGCDTPCSEPGTDLLDLWGDSDDEYG